MKITNEEALNIVLVLARSKLNEIQVARVKKTNSMLESVEIIKYKKAMEIVKDFDGKIMSSICESNNPNIVLTQEDDDWNYKQYYGGSPVVTDMRDEALLKLDMGEALNKPPNKFNP